MKVLLLHPEDKLSPTQFQGWDLIVDMGRSPASTYEEWSRLAQCRVVSLYSYARGFEDLYQLKQIPHIANGVVDKFDIDWWDVVFPMFHAGFERHFMLLGLARELGSSVRLYSSRADERASALQKFLNIECLLLNKDSSALARKVRHFAKAFSHLDFGQLTQIVKDKYDPQHSIRRRLAHKRKRVDGPVFLLPTAYVNVSRTEVAYASLLPEEKFLLVAARPGGKLASLPANVQMISLDGYFDRIDTAEFASLMEKWNELQRQLVSKSPELRMAEALGVFKYGPELMRWGIAARDAWMRLFESENIAGCLSADDSNPYTSLPLFMARQHGIPTLAVHHGALECRMAFRAMRADYYLAKGELEHDYLLNTCHMDPEKIVVGGPQQTSVTPSISGEKPWLVFFTEPYGLAGWRPEDVYRDLLPPLLALARQCGLKLVFKMHPFESIKGHRNLLRKLLSPSQFAEIEWFAGAITPELWGKIRFAMTVESTVALDCAFRKIPIFLCAWLQHVYGNYLQQYAKYGIGLILNSPNEMQNVPQMLATWKKCEAAVDGKIWQMISPAELRNLLTGKYQSQSAQIGTSQSNSF